MDDFLFSLAILLIVAPAALIVIALFSTASGNDSLRHKRFSLSDWMLVAAVVISWLPMVLGIVLRIGDGNPSVDIGYAVFFTVISATLLLTRRAMRRRISDPEELR